MPGFNIGGGDGPSNSPDLHRSHRWEIINLGGYVRSEHRMCAKSLSLPTFAAEEEIVMGAAIKYKFAKAINWEDVQLSFYDTVGLYASLLKWQDAVYTADAGIKPASSYKADAAFTLVDGDGFPIGQEITLKNSWPKSISHSPLSYESSDIKQIDITLSYDWAEFVNQGNNA